MYSGWSVLQNKTVTDWSFKTPLHNKVLNSDQPVLNGCSDRRFSCKVLRQHKLVSDPSNWYLIWIQANLAVWLTGGDLTHLIAPATSHRVRHRKFGLCSTNFFQKSCNLNYSRPHKACKAWFQCFKDNYEMSPTCIKYMKDLKLGESNNLAQWVVLSPYDLQIIVLHSFSIPLMLINTIELQRILFRSSLHVVKTWIIEILSSYQCVLKQHKLCFTLGCRLVLTLIIAVFFFKCDMKIPVRPQDIV